MTWILTNFSSFQDATAIFSNGTIYIHIFVWFGWNQKIQTPSFSPKMCEFPSHVNFGTSTNYANWLQVWRYHYSIAVCKRMCQVFVQIYFCHFCHYKPLINWLHIFSALLARRNHNVWNAQVKNHLRIIPGDDLCSVVWWFSGWL